MKPETRSTMFLYVVILVSLGAGVKERMALMDARSEMLSLVERASLDFHGLELC
jgi:hypothetical protein